MPHREAALAPAPLKVLLVENGAPSEALVKAVGSYDRWFAAELGPRAAMSSIKAFEGEALPDARQFDAVVFSGSPLSVTRIEPWMEQAGAWMVEAAAKGVPVLGVCFGHQLLAHALGGRVVKNPLGREIGTIEVDLTEAGARDPLFATQSGPLRFQATHEDVVDRLPAEATLLATNRYGIHAFRHGPRAWGVQFHPEMNAERLGALIRTREAPLRAEGLWEQALGSLGESPRGPTLLGAFLDQVEAK